MAEEKTRIIPRKGATTETPEPRIANGQIVFFCPAGHRLAVPVQLGGKRGKCGKCGVFLQIPLVEQPAETPSGEPQSADEEPAGGDQDRQEPADGPVAEPEPPVPAPEDAAGPAVEPAWNFESPPGDAAVAVDTWPVSGELAALPETAGDNPTAQLVERLWMERNHGGIVELHLAGGNVILPEEFAARWSRGTHGLFASQAADGTVTVTAVAWDTIQRIVVRQLAAVPDDLFG